MRQQYGLGAVLPSSLLHAVALQHSDDMILRDYFAHTSPSGQTVKDRIMRSGFVTGYSWMGGETLAWGTGTLAGAVSTVKAWMAQPGAPRDPALAALHADRHQPRLRPLPRPRRRVRVDGRLGRALVAAQRLGPAAISAAAACTARTMPW